MKQKGKLILNARTLSNLFVVLVGIAFYLAISHFDVVRSSMAGFLHILAPFIMPPQSGSTCRPVARSSYFSSLPNI